MTRVVLNSTTAVAALLLSAPLMAQGNSAQTGEEDSADDNIIIVTATKREQTLQDIPVAVTVTSAETIEQAQIRDVVDLQTVVPSLRVGQLQSSGSTNFFIRGFGNGATNAGIEPSVGVFIDGVYRSRSAAAISDLPNLERVEVLRGPQSTLFGKNASAGVISVITQKPQFDLGGSVEASYGNFNAVVAKAYVTGPLSDTVAASLAAGYNRRDGFIDNQLLGNDSNERNRWNVRGQLLWEPNADTSFRLIADYDKIDEVCCAATNLVAGPTAGIVQVLAGGQGLIPNDPFSRDVFYNFDSTNELENGGVSLQGEFNFGDISLTSISSFRIVRSFRNQDSDFNGADLIGLNNNNTDIDTFTQEIRLSSDYAGPVNWLLGGYYFNESIDIEDEIAFGSQFRGYADALIGAATGGALDSAVLEFGLGQQPGSFFRAGDSANEFITLKDESWSIFGQVDFDITDRLTLTGGFNYTEDRKRSSINQINTDVFSGLDLDDPTFAPFRNQLLFGGALAQGVGNALMLGRAASAAEIAGFAADPATAPVFAAIQTGAQAFANANDNNPAANPLAALKPFQFLPPFVDFPNAVESGRTKDTDFSWSTRLSYDVTDDLNAYFSYATGFKASSINLSRNSQPFPQDLPALTNAGLTVPNLVPGSRFAGPEEAEVFEFGLKANFGLARFNLAVFEQSIKGFQSNIFTGTGFILANAGKQSTKGIEFEGNVNPTDALTLTMAMTYLDPVYDSFVRSGVIDAAGNPVDLSGTRPAGIPDISMTLGATYVWEFDSADELVAHVDYAYESDVRIVENLPASITRSTNLMSASLSYKMDSGWDFTIWGRNLLNDKFLISAFPAVAQAGSISAFPSQPRTYGIAVRKKF